MKTEIALSEEDFVRYRTAYLAAFLFLIRFVKPNKEFENQKACIKFIADFFDITKEGVQKLISSGSKDNHYHIFVAKLHKELSKFKKGSTLKFFPKLERLIEFIEFPLLLNNKALNKSLSKRHKLERLDFILRVVFNFEEATELLRTMSSEFFEFWQISLQPKAVDSSSSLKSNELAKEPDYLDVSGMTVAKALAMLHEKYFKNQKFSKKKLMLAIAAAQSEPTRADRLNSDLKRKHKDISEVFRNFEMIQRGQA